MVALGDSRITDTGLLPLRTMKQLQFVSLEKTKVTDLGVYDLRKFLPQLRVQR
jgi:hypothetical protein